MSEVPLYTPNQDGIRCGLDQTLSSELQGYLAHKKYRPQLESP